MCTRTPSNVFHRAAIITALVCTALILSFGGTASAWPPGGNGGGPGGGGGGGGGGTSAPYTLVDLKGFAVTYSGGTFVQSAASAVNDPDDLGTVQVVGISAAGDFQDNESHPVLWEVDSDGSFVRTDLGLPPQAYEAGATDINNWGVITVNSIQVYNPPNSGAPYPAWVLVPGLPLQQLPVEGDDAKAWRINDLDEIVGQSGVRNDSTFWVLDSDGIPQSGMTFGNFPSSFKAADLANSGLMAGHNGQEPGFGEDPYDPTHVDGMPSIAWFDVDNVLQIQPLLQVQGSATAISPDGNWVAGWVLDPDGSTEAFLWSDATGIQLLGRLGGQHSHALSVRNNGDVVGWSDTGSRKHPFTAVLWKAGQLFDLNVLAGVGRSQHLMTAEAINGAGHIVGYMNVSVGGGVEEHAYTLIPN